MPLHYFVMTENDNQQNKKAQDFSEALLSRGKHSII